MIRLASSARAAIAGNGWLIGKLVVIAVLMAWTIFSYADVDWEFLYTKHYFMQRYYGGYAHAIVIDQKRPIVESLEGTPSLYHVFAFLDRADDRYIGTYNVDRLYTSGFLPASSCVSPAELSVCGLRFILQIICTGSLRSLFHIGQRRPGLAVAMPPSPPLLWPSPIPSMP